MNDLSTRDCICIEGLEIFANHGVFPEENTLGQKFVFDLTLYASLQKAGENDDLEASVDYGAVCHAVDAFVREHTFKLIEAVAEGVAALVLDKFELVDAVTVKVSKPWAPIGLPLKTAAVKITRSR